MEQSDRICSKMGLLLQITGQGVGCPWGGQSAGSAPLPGCAWSVTGPLPRLPSSGGRCCSCWELLLSEAEWDCKGKGLLGGSVLQGGKKSHELSSSNSLETIDMSKMCQDVVEMWVRSLAPCTEVGRAGGALQGPPQQLPAQCQCLKCPSPVLLWFPGTETLFPL